MENELKTSPKFLIQSGNSPFETKTPPHSQQLDSKSPNSGNDFCITGSPPDRLRVPKPFKYPERYKSPTDLIMSPISKGLLARSRKSVMLLPPTRNKHNIQDLSFQEVGLFQT